MAETSPDARTKNGSTADRSPLKDAAGTVIGSGVVGVLVGTMDWLNKMQAAHHYVQPDNALEVMWASAIAPVVVILYKIVMNRLNKAEKESAT